MNLMEALSILSKSSPFAVSTERQHIEHDFNTSNPVLELTNVEKHKVLEFLCKELSIADKSYSSPDWHKDVLDDTEKRMAEGKERLIDWKDAKEMLRRN